MATNPPIDLTTFAGSVELPADHPLLQGVDFGPELEIMPEKMAMNILVLTARLDQLEREIWQLKQAK